MRKDNLLGDLLVLLIGIIFAVAVSFYSAFVMMRLFNWFLTPVFNHQFSYWGTYGISLILSLITLKYETNNNKNNISDEIVTVIAITLVKIIVLSVFLGIGAWVSLGV